MTTTKTVSAEQVKAAAANVAPAHGGRVYIYDVLVELIEGQGVWMTGAELRSELVRLHRAGSIRLSRCDMPAAHAAEKLGEDGTCRYLSSEFHFVAV